MFLLATLFSWMNFTPGNFVNNIPSTKFYPFIHWTFTNDILWMLIHENWMTFNAKHKLVNELHFMDEIKQWPLFHPNFMNFHGWTYPFH
jgi:hypothetical protein